MWFVGKKYMANVPVAAEHSRLAILEWERNRRQGLLPVTMKVPPPQFAVVARMGRLRRCSVTASAQRRSAICRLLNVDFELGSGNRDLLDKI
jgi:hypothetical protein